MPSSKVHLLIFIISLFIASFLMWHTFSYSNKSFLIASTVWSDFGASLPLIRSFSLGQNWPPQHPLYPGQPIRYHYLFYAFCGLLEKTGLPISFALNLPSALGLAFLMYYIWRLSYTVFHHYSVSVLSLLFFIFNGSFSFIDFFRNRPLSLSTLTALIQLKEFPSFAPWNGSQIAAFWNLNIYTNQRHLGISFAIVTFIIYCLYTGRKVWLTGFLMGILYFTNQASFSISLIFIFSFFIFSPSTRKNILLSIIGLLPWLPLLSTLSFPVNSLKFHFGFLQDTSITLISWVKYWLQNFGLHFLLIPLGLSVAPKRTRVFILPLVVLFFLSNTFQLSVDVINNHKLLNFFLIIGSMFSAYFIYSLYHFRFGKIIAPIIVTFLTLGGIIDLFPFLNSHFIKLADYKLSPDSEFFFRKTSPSDIVLNSFWFYHPASLAGRPIYNGYPYFTWSYGYDQVEREKQTISIYASPDIKYACAALHKAGVSFVELSSYHEEFIRPNHLLWDMLPTVYSNGVTGTKVYSVFQICQTQK